MRATWSNLLWGPHLGQSGLDLSGAVGSLCSGPAVGACVVLLIWQAQINNLASVLSLASIPKPPRSAGCPPVGCTSANGHLLGQKPLLPRLSTTHRRRTAPRAGTASPPPGLLRSLRPSPRPSVMAVEAAAFVNINISCCEEATVLFLAG